MCITHITFLLFFGDKRIHHYKLHTILILDMRFDIALLVHFKLIYNSKFLESIGESRTRKQLRTFTRHSGTYVAPFYFYFYL